MTSKTIDRRPGSGYLPLDVEEAAKRAAEIVDAEDRKIEIDRVMAWARSKYPQYYQPKQ